MAKVGRPLRFKTVAELEKAIDKYYKECEEKKLPKTMSGLAVACGVDRQTILNYGKKEEFFCTIKRHREIVEKELEERALAGQLNPTMAIFALKNNFMWKDKQEIEQTVNNFEINITGE